jgi:hypothetical protein
MFLGTLMVMILIAMMDYTQEETNENEWIRQVSVYISPLLKIQPMGSKITCLNKVGKAGDCA